MIIGFILIAGCNLYLYYSIANLIFVIISFIYLMITTYIEEYVLIKDIDLNKKLFMISHQGAYLISISEFMEYASRDIGKSIALFGSSLVTFNIVIAIIVFGVKRWLR